MPHEDASTRLSGVPSCGIQLSSLASRDAVFQIGPQLLRVVKADITQLPDSVDAVVNSDDNYLSHGGGVSAAIWAAAGPRLPDFVAMEPPKLTAADVYVTPACDLRAHLIFHAVTIDYDLGKRLEASDASVLYGRVLDTANHFQCETLATPLLGAGAARAASRTESAEIAASGLATALWERANEATSLRQILLTDPMGTYEASRDAVSRKQMVPLGVSTR